MKHKGTLFHHKCSQSGGFSPRSWVASLVLVLAYVVAFGAGANAVTAATLNSPTPGTKLTGAGVTFKWGGGVDVTAYMLYIGTTAGASDIDLVNAGTATSAAVSNLPTNGEKLYVGIWSEIGGAWYHNDSTYVASGTGTAAVITTPTPGSKLVSTKATFSWTKGSGISKYKLYIGTTAGASDLALVATTNTSATVSNLPNNGSTLYATLYSLNGNTWLTTNCTFKAASVIVTVTPKTATLGFKATLQFTAAVANATDKTVTWKVNGTTGGNSTVGTISASGLYTAPSAVPGTNPVTVRAVSNADATKSATASVTISAALGNDAMLNGRYAFFLQGWDAHGAIASAGSITADGAGHITSGLMDQVRYNAKANFAVSGTYSIGTDNRGMMTLKSGTSTYTFRLAVDSLGNTSLVEFDTVTSSAAHLTGKMKKQDSTAFNLTKVAGNYAFGWEGEVYVSGASHLLAMAGRWTLSSAGVLSNAVLDATAMGTTTKSAVTNSAALSIDPTTGRGTITIHATSLPLITTTFDLVVYVVSAKEMFVVQSDIENSSNTVSLVAGRCKRQSGTFSLATMNGKSIFQSNGNESNTAHVLVGQASSNGAGSMSVTVGGNEGGIVGTDIGMTASYVMASNGRGVITFVVNPIGAKPQVLYAVGPNEGFLLQSNGSATTLGYIEPQTALTYSATNVAGNFTVNTVLPQLTSVADDSGFLKLTSAGAVSGTIDVASSSGIAAAQAQNGTFTMKASGEGSITLSSGIATSMSMWMVSPTRAIAVLPIVSGKTNAEVIELQR